MALPSIDIKSIALGGYLRSGNIAIPNTGDTDYIFQPAYLPSASPFAPVAYWPDTTSLHTVQNWNTAHPGLEWTQPFYAYGMTGPVIYEIVQGPSGMTIGSKMLRDAVTGYFKFDEFYGVLKWENPTAGRHKIGVRATDQLGQMVYWVFDLHTDASRNFFMALNATGNGSGSSPSNYASYASTVTGDATVSPATGKVLRIKGDTYPATTGIYISGTYKPVSWVAMPSETPVFSQRFNLGSDNIHIHGIKFSNVGTPDFGVINGSGIQNRIGVWDCEFDACYKVGTGNNNNACIGLNKSGDGFGRERIFVQSCIFRNCTTLHGFDYYTVKDSVWCRNEMIITNGTSLLPTSWIFPKMMANGCEILHNVANVTSLTSTDPSVADVLQIYNAWDAGHATSFDLTQRIEYNYIRTGGSPVFRGNGADNLSPSFSTVRNYTKRNTFIGGAVTANNYFPASVDRQSFFESNVCQNSSGGIIAPANSSSWFFKTGTNIEGTSGLVDTNGHLVNTTERGKTGHGIWRP